jgi:hypothetical protein
MMFFGGFHAGILRMIGLTFEELTSTAGWQA